MLVAQITLYLFNLQILPSFKRTWILILFFALQIFTYLYSKESNYYQIYGINRTFTQGELKQAQKAIMLRYHPDKNPESSLELFDKMRSINDVLKTDLQIYDAYGPFQRINNNDPLPQLKNQVYLERVLIYLLMFMATSVQASGNEGKPLKKYLFIILGISFFADSYLYQETDLYLNSGLLPKLALFEAIIILRTFVSIILSSFAVQIKQAQSLRRQRVANLDLDELKHIEKEHQKYLDEQNSWKAKASNALFYLIAIGLCVIYFMGL